MSIAYLVRYHYTNLGILGFGAHTQKDINIVIIVNWYRNTLTIMLLIILWFFFWLDAVVHFQGEFLIQKANSSKQNNETSCYLWPRKQCEKASNSFIRRKKKLKNKYMILSVSVCHTRHLVKKSSHMIFRCGFWKRMEIFASLMMIQNLRFTEKEVQKFTQRYNNEKTIGSFQCFNFSYFCMH